MRSYRLALAVAAVSLIPGVAPLFARVAPVRAGSVCLAADEKSKGEKEKEEHEVKVEIKDLPAAVVEGIKKEMPEGKITDAEKQTENGKTTYEIDVEVDKKSFEVVVSEDGKILSKKEEDRSKEKKDVEEKHEKHGKHEDKDK